METVRQKCGEPISISRPQPSVSVGVAMSVYKEIPSDKTVTGKHAGATYTADIEKWTYKFDYYYIWTFEFVGGNLAKASSTKVRR